MRLDLFYNVFYKQIDLAVIVFSRNVSIYRKRN
jgi:hypothetical protein